ncbi:thioesterase family protein [Thermoflexus sp.]|uniref:acyl-CoA thioesterase n=1 Tax=Thermoflexus sp. TaxID=1969742 RepID=UPI001752B41A|nr:thioesterase family protein [Thermoflexus sp.]
MKEDLFPPDLPFRMAVPIEVRFRDMDAMGHVNNAVYFTYFEQARLHYIRQLAGLPPPLEPFGMIVAEALCQYRAPITMGMPIQVWIRVAEVRQRSFVFLYKIERCDSGHIMALGRSVQVAYDYAQGVPVPIPESWRERFLQFEAGTM